ncbi:hypothetical protein BN1051_02825 [Arthrobacter saudimassiliensis]|uniref:HpcH/HpaI aldolase/citrate lyase family protein n=1 Tax=Arthrobacter saudimassiliensis TaxID=1461584 RepID=A0A078MT13_9MICC|nr:hypothetical protein BN1051_02825 [Arthrobacter saudimassiliensis]
MTVFTDADRAELEAMLADTDRLLATAYPGDPGTRQPVHTVYVPANRFTPDLPAAWGAEALDAAARQGGLARLAADLGLDGTPGSGAGASSGAGEAEAVAALVQAKLESEPIEDLRLDFEDGYGTPDDGTEDADARAAAAAVVRAREAGTAPPFIGIRFKSFEAATRTRGLRTLDLFLAGLLEGGDLPDGLVLTLPKVSTAAQATAMAWACARLEERHGLPAGRLRFEVQVETPQLILGPDGTVPVAALLHAADGRISGLHYGTYDYSDALQIAPAWQAMDHPGADYAKAVMQVAAAGTGVRLSDGSTNILPLGADEEVLAAWRLHARLVRRSLERGYYQGWDLHAAQLPTRYLATYAFYRDGVPAAVRRLENYLSETGGGVLDEPATARALARFVDRALACGAVTDAEALVPAGLDRAQLARLARRAAGAAGSSADGGSGPAASDRSGGGSSRSAADVGYAADAGPPSP